MTRFDLNSNANPPIPVKNTTCLLLLDCQLGFKDLNAWGNGTASNPAFEANVTSLLATFRQAIDAVPVGQRPFIVHVIHPSVWSDSPLHYSYTGAFGPNGEIVRGTDFLPFAAPRRTAPDGSHRFITTFDERTATAGPTTYADGTPVVVDELLMTTHGHSVFTNSPFESILRDKGITTLLVAGLALDWSVSTAIRTARDLALTGKWGGRGNMDDAPMNQRWTDGERVYVDDDASGKRLVEMPRIILVGDATRLFGKGSLDVSADTQHDIHLESLKTFAEVKSTREVVEAMKVENVTPRQAI